ncbi:MAG: MFS transporter [Methylocystaceae bacterium]
MQGKSSTYIMLAVLITAFLTPFTGSAINLAVPAMSKDLNASTVTLTWMSTGFLLSSAALLLPVGKLADIYGRKKVFSIGVAIFGLSSLGCGIAPNTIILLTMRILQGIGGACVFSTGMAMLTTAFPAEVRGKILGINAGVVYIGVSAGPVLGGLITHSLSWRYIFYISFGLTLLAQFATLRIKEAPQRRTSGGFNLYASVLYSLGLIGTMYGIAAINDGWLPRISLIIGIILLAMFIAQDMKTEAPLFNIRTFIGNRVFINSNLAALISYAATSGLGFLISLYLQLVKGLNPALAGTVMLAQPAVMALVAPYSGRLSDRLEPQKVATWGMIFTAMGLMIFFFLHGDSPLYWVVIGLMVTGFGFSLFGPPNNNAIMSSVPPSQFGLAASTLSTARLVGQTLSMTMVTLIIATIIGNVKPSPQQAPQIILTLRITMALFVILTIPGIIASQSRGKVHQTTTD